MGACAVHTNSKEINSSLFSSIDGQVQLMKRVLNSCGLSPDDIAYLETTGFGLKNIDANELEAIDKVYGKRKEPLYVGSILSNLGNAIPVNSINAIIKVIQSYFYFCKLTFFLLYKESCGQIILKTWSTLR